VSDKCTSKNWGLLFQVLRYLLLWELGPVLAVLASAALRLIRFARKKKEEHFTIFNPSYFSIAPQTIN